MSTESRKVQIVAEVDATPARAGFEEVKAGARDMAQAVEKSGKQAGEGIKGIGDGGEPAAQKLDRATKSIIASIQRSTAAMQAGGQANAQYFESIAQQRGINVDVLRPYLKGLDDAVAKNAAMNQAMHGSTVSAKQMEQALRGVPAQFTDIFTSIASGQQPLTVFLQQGGQLKDMFGGAGAAANALGSYVVGLVNPLTLAAATAGLLAVAYNQGSKEADALSQALIMTGNAAGASTPQLQAMAKAVAATVGATQGAANEAIAAAASTGKIAAGNIELVSQAALKLNRAVGASIQDTISDFAELGKEPVKASEKLNEKYNYLTASIYQQIKALEDQGKTLEAGALAQKAYADAMSGRADAVVANLGSIERAWKGIIDTSKRAWDAMLGVGRQATLADQIAEQKKVIEGLRDGSEVGNIDIAQKRLATLEAMATAQGKAAAATAAAGQQEQARIAWLKESDKYLSKAEKMEREITRARNEGAAAGASQAEIEKRIAKIREDLTEKPKKAGKSQEVKDAEELARILDRINGKQTGLDASYYTDLQKLFKGYQAGKLDLEKYRGAVESLTVSQKFHTDNLKAEADARKEAEKAQSAYFDHWQKYLGSLDDEARKLEDQALLWGLGKQALADLNLIRAEETLAKARDNGVSDDYLAKLEQEVELRRRIAQSTGQIEAREANKKAADDAAREWQRVSDDIAHSLTDAIFGGGKNGWELLVDTIKATVIRAYVQPVIQGGINSVLGSVIGAPAGQGNIFGSAVSLGAQAAGLSGLGSYTGAAGFLQLGSMASSFSTGLSAAAAGADLTAAIGAYQAAGMGATATSLGAGASAAGALGSSAGLVSGALSGVMTAAPYLAAGMLIAQQLGAFNGPTYHKGGAYLAGTDGSFTKASNSNVGNWGLTWGAYTSDRSRSYDDAMLGISAALAKQISTSIEQYGGQALDLTIASRFASDNDDWSEGAYRVMDQYGAVVADFYARYTKDANKALDQFSQDSARTLLAALQKTDLADEFDALFSSLDPFKASVAEINQLFERASAIQQQIASINGGIDAAFLSPAEQLQKAFAALGKTIPGTVQAYEDLVRAQNLQTSAGRDAAAGLLGTYQLWGQVQAESNKASDQQAQLYKQLMQLTGNTAELRRLELEALDPSNRAMQQRLWALEDERALLDKLAGAKATLASAYQTEASALQSTVDRMRGFATSLRDFRDSLLLGSASPLTPGQQYDEARRQFEATYAKARQGDETALQGLQQSASSFLEASRTYNASGAAYTLDFEAVRAALGDSAISAAAAADVAQLQLNVVKDQLKLLGDINDTGNTVAAGIESLRQAVLQAVASGVRPDAGSVGALTGGARGEWVTVGGAFDAYRSTAGATGLQVGNELTVFGANKSTLTQSQIRDYVNNLLASGQEQLIYTEAKAFGITLAELDQIMGWPVGDAEAWAKRNGLPAFAAGGYHPGGLALVGERGPELINFEAPAQILDSARTRDALSGTGSSAELVRELQTLRAEVRALREQQRAETAVIVEAQFGAADRNAQAIAGAQSAAHWAATTQPEIV